VSLAKVEVAVVIAEPNNPHPWHELELPGAPELAYDFLTDTSFVGEWHPDVRRMSGDGDELIEHRQLASLVPIILPFPLTVVERSRGVRYVVRADVAASLIRIEGRYDLSAIKPGGGTRVRISYRVTPRTAVARPAAAALRVLLTRAARVQARAMPEGFERWLAIHESRRN
jgi:hypothetical protein